MPTTAHDRPLARACAAEILKARVLGAAIESPLDPAPRLSRRLGNRVLLKREDLQPVFSFKVRGAYNKIASLPPAELARGVIASSAGNHAQGVALAARERGVRAVIVMPATAPSIKVEAVRSLGGEVVLHGDTYDDANEHARAIAAREGLAFVPPFDDPAVIAGQGTIALELERQWPEPPHAVLVPIGGGGLIGGIGAFLKERHPEVQVVGVEPVEAASMHAAFEHGGPVTLPHVGIFADGVAVRRVSERTYALAREVVDRIILVDTDEICAAIKDVFEDCRVVTEPAGALAVAGLKRYVADTGCGDRTLIAIASGANMNFDRLRHVSERAEIGEHREALFAAEIPERPGEFLRFCAALGPRNVTEFNYRFAPGVERARIFVGVALTGGRAESGELLRALEAAGYRVLDLSDNELAKLHVRHMVGGPVPAIENELLYRFEFPERPGALLKFLHAIGSRWNISLFHYRNHGSDYGRVLAGVQVPPAERARFARHLAQLGYEHTDESANPAYSLFLGPAR